MIRIIEAYFDTTKGFRTNWFNDSEGIALDANRTVPGDIIVDPTSWMLPIGIVISVEKRFDSIVMNVMWTRAP